MARATGRAMGALTAVGVLAGTLAGPAVAASPSAESGPRTYQMAKDAQPIEGAPSSIDGPLLRPGIYTDTLEVGEEVYYTVELDGTSNTYVSGVVAAKPGTKVAYSDGFELGMERTDGEDCGSTERIFELDGGVRPIADYTSRLIEPDGSCQEAGTYLVTLKRDSEPTSSPEPWPIELRLMVEPGVQGGIQSEGPDEDAFSTEPPAEPTGQPKDVTGGTGFNDAPAISDGVWKDRIAPGETRFFRVPIDWAQRLFADVEFGNSPGEDSDYVSEGVRVELYNTARSIVANQHATYEGAQQEIKVGTAPTAFSNRFSDDSVIRELRFSGWYYLAVSMNPEVGTYVKGTVPFLLRAVIQGEPGKGPQYLSDPTKAGFGVTEDDREQARDGVTPEQAAESSGGSQLVLAVAGLGAGTVLLVGLGLWMLLARRRAAPVDAVPPTPPYGYGPAGRP